MSEREHWESVYAGKEPDDVSWYRPHLERSLRFIEETGLPRTAAILDVGGGASTLVDDVLARGYSDVTVLDISERAVAFAKTRLGSRAEAVTWLVADILKIELPEQRYDFWHDRAVFHFLIEESARQLYVAAVRRALRPNGHIVVATFGPAAPTWRRSARAPGSSGASPSFPTSRSSACRSTRAGATSTRTTPGSRTRTCSS